jgi:thymidine kinase
MAKTHTPSPKNEQKRYGEYATAKWLSNLTGRDMHLWFGVNYLDAVGDIDILLADERCGLWGIEVKGHSLTQIEGYSRTHVTFAGNGSRPEKHPGLKAQLEAQRLSSWIKSNASKRELPWVHSAVWWPNILRNDWMSAFTNSDDALRDAEFMLFTDEMDSENVFFERLARIADQPLYGLRPPQRVFSQNSRYKDLVSVFDAPSKQIAPIFPDVLRPKSDQEQSKFVDSPRVRIAGKPGTGKTVKLLEFGFHHANNRQRVLYTCYNKTLSSEIRREVGEKLPKMHSGELLAMDIFQLSKYLVNGLTSRPQGKQLSFSKGGSYEESFEKSVALILDEGAPEPFDVILIDEAQDFPEYGVKLLQELSHENTKWVAVDGQGQELYPPFAPAESLKAEMEQAEVLTLRRNFRQSPQAYLVYQSFDIIMEKSNLDSGSIAARKQLALWLDKSNKGQEAIGQLGFDFDLGETRAEISIEDSRDVARALEQNLLIPMARQEGRVDALILAPQRKSSSMEIVRRLLNDRTIPFQDLVEIENRRKDPGPSSIRLSTIHSARGLTADFVCVFEFDEACTWHGGRGRQLATIALSRARKQTVVLTLGKQSEYFDALKSLVTKVDNFFAEQENQAIFPAH